MDVLETDETQDAQPTLSPLRERIGELDETLLGLLAERQRLARDIARAKSEGALPLRDVGREAELLGRHVARARELGLNPQYVTRIFHAVMEESVRAQRGELMPAPARATVAVLGGEGSYSALAARAHFAGTEGLELVPRPRFADVVRALREGQVEHAVLPIENSTTGAIAPAYDLLRDGAACVVGEQYLRIRHGLLAPPGVALSGVRRVLGHPQALAQCEDFLQARGLALEYCDSTADALARVRAAGGGLAAVAGPEVAAAHGLVVLADGIANSADNETRFVVLARAVRPVPASVPCKTSLLFSTWQRPGALADVLLAFRDHGINLTRIESRPTPGQAWQELFFVDLEGNVESAPVAAALEAVARCTRSLRVLGCYPSERLPPTQVPAAVLAQAAGPAPAEAPRPAPRAARSTKGWTLASRAHKPEDTVIQVGPARVGEGFVVMGGPCSVESEAQIEQCAAWAAEHGAQLLRGGCFKPRTNPYSFQGLGLPGLALMKAAGARHGLPIVTEVMSPEDVEAVARDADVLQVGARNMQNFALLKALGQVRRPVMLKRGLMNTLEEWLQAAEYILAGGNGQVMLCERGIRTFETATRSTLDLSAVPVLRELTHLPVIVDPSHAAGRRDLVAPLALAAKAVGAHGVIVEFHPEPEKALSDGPQALHLDQFARMMHDLYAK